MEKVIFSEVPDIPNIVGEDVPKVLITILVKDVWADTKLLPLPVDDIDVKRLESGILVSCKVCVFVLYRYSFKASVSTVIDLVLKEFTFVGIILYFKSQNLNSY